MHWYLVQNDVTSRYAMSHGLCEATDSNESEHTNTYIDDRKGKGLF